VLELDAGGRGRVGRLWGDGFEIETIINTRVAKARLAIAEVPSFEFRRRHGQSNLNTCGTASVCCARCWSNA
jgi:hypothetical protein